MMKKIFFIFLFFLGEAFGSCPYVECAPVTSAAAQVVSAKITVNEQLIDAAFVLYKEAIGQELEAEKLSIETLGILEMRTAENFVLLQEIDFLLKQKVELLEKINKKSRG